VRPAIIETLKRAIKGDGASKFVIAMGTSENSREVSIASGDRLRIRDYILDIEGVAKVGDDPWVLLCSKRMAHLVHDRIPVYRLDEHPPKEEVLVINLANYLIYRQWSACTDLYGVAAIPLYCVLSSRYEDSATLDEAFLQLMTALDQTITFSSVWGTLEGVRLQLEETGDRVGAQAPYVDIGVGKPSPTVEGDKTLYHVAKIAVNNILGNVQHAHLLYEACGKNLARFVLFVHFVLSCLHLRDSLPARTRQTLEEVAKDRKVRWPFCDTRLAKPSDPDPSYGKIPALVARDRLKQVQDQIFDKSFDEFVCEEALRFDPREKFEVSLDNQRLTLRVESLRKEIEDAVTVAGDIKKKRETRLLGRYSPEDAARLMDAILALAGPRRSGK
jgi:hypothetical protein